MNENQRFSINSLFSRESERSLKSNICDQFLLYIPLIFSLILLISGIILFLFIEQKNKHVEIIDNESFFQLNSTLNGLKSCSSSNLLYVCFQKVFSQQIVIGHILL